ncbi:MAG: toll/interleukin-1 receptor domain-containing protein, partial [Lachnospiraceae bacterium]|nr:toll/interleukin-1 receptor domain-containing protein [Lachnospiraceae bacterium]
MQIFLSHSSKDAAIAEQICEQLEKNGIRCFIAPRNIRPGKEYAEEIINGIDESAAVVLLMSGNANSSPHVLREVEHAVSGGTPILVYKIEDVALSKSMEYFLMTHQWVSSKPQE